MQRGADPEVWSEAATSWVGGIPRTPAESTDCQEWVCSLDRLEHTQTPSTAAPGAPSQSRIHSRLPGKQRGCLLRAHGPGCSQTPWWPAANSTVPWNCHTKSLRKCHLRSPNSQSTPIKINMQQRFSHTRQTHSYFSSESPESWAPGSHGKWGP